MVQLACRAVHFCGSGCSVCVVFHYFYIALFVNVVVPHQAITGLYALVVLRLLPITFSVDEKFGCRIVGIDKYGYFFSFSAFPVPMRENMKCFSLLVPYAAVSLVPVLWRSS